MESYSLEWFFTLMVFILPAYIANSSALYFDPGRLVISWLGYTPLGLTFDEWFWVSLFSSIGAHVGDKIGSFVKRRMDLKSGSKFEYFDQLGFIIFALAFAAIASPKVSYFLGLDGYLALIILSYVVHVSANRFAYAIGLKDVPW